MDRLVTVRDIQDRYGCSLPTARRYIRQMIPHMENPLTATETAFREWEERRTVYPPEISKKRKVELMQRQTGRVIVPRTW